MSSNPTADDLRCRVAAHLERLHALAVHRNELLHRAASDARPAIARALRANRELADIVRAAARRARAHLAQLEASGCVPVCGNPAKVQIDLCRAATDRDRHDS